MTHIPLTPSSLPMPFVKLPRMAKSTACILFRLTVRAALAPFRVMLHAATAMGQAMECALNDPYQSPKNRRD